MKRPSRTPKRPGRLASFRGPQIERFQGFTWNEGNRLRHLQYRPEIDFPIVERLDRSRVKKRKDTTHPADPPRFNALALLPEADLVVFVVYAKSEGLMNIISVRLADADETEVYFTP